MQGFSVRPFSAADSPRLHDIRSAAFVEIFRSFRAIIGSEIAAAAMHGAEDEQAALLDGFTGEDASKELLVACLNDHVIGFAALSYDYARLVGEIVLTAVHPDQAGKGYGTELNLNALRRMKARGMRVATVGTGGDPSHAAARRAYEKSGFASAIPNVILYRTLDDLT